MVGAVKANTQAGRGGACTTYYSIYDPEVETIVRLKNPMSPEDKKIRGMDYALMANEFAAKKAAKNEKIFTWNQKSAPDLWEAFFSSDQQKFAEVYDRYENDPAFKKNYIDAREIILAAHTEGFETGRAYLLWIDEVNRHTPFKDPIYSSNLCVAPETKLLTNEGYKEIQTLVNQKVVVWNGEQWSESVVMKTGTNQKLIKVVTDSGHEIDCTPYHKFYVFDGYTKPYKELRAYELKPGHKLAKFDLPLIQGYKTLDKAYINGFYSADGSDTRQGQCIYLYGQEKMLLINRFEGGKGNWTLQEQYNRIYKHYNDLKPKFFVPGPEYTVQDRLTWLAGYLDGDGCVYRNGDNQQLTASSTEWQFLQDIQLMLQTLGINSKIVAGADEGYKKMPLNDGSGGKGDFFCKQVWRLLINSTDTQKLLWMGIPLGRLVVIPHEPNRNANHFIKVVDIIDEGRQDDTYCLNEPLRHTVMFNGILTGQCLEIALPTAGYPDMKHLYSSEDHGKGEIALCSLAGIIPANIKDDEEYYTTAYYALLMIDVCIHKNDYVFDHLEVTATSRLNAGVGLVGVAHDMAKHRQKYSTKEGKQYLHWLAERHMFMLIKASLQLAKELGPAPWIHKTKWVDGWLPIDTYKKTVDTVVPNDLVYPWETIRQEIVEVGGIRNSCLVAHMPAETSSKASGTSNGIYPIRRLSQLKGDSDVVIQWAAPESGKLGKYYEPAYEIPVKDMIECYAIFFKFTDQSISADLWYLLLMGQTVTSKELLKNYFYMTKLGFKSRYYVNMRTSDGVHFEEAVEVEGVEEKGCVGGACSL